MVAEVKKIVAPAHCFAIVTLASAEVRVRELPAKVITPVPILITSTPVSYTHLTLPTKRIV